jgi:hypothetical protein
MFVRQSQGAARLIEGLSDMQIEIAHVEDVLPIIVSFTFYYNFKLYLLEARALVFWDQKVYFHFRVFHGHDDNFFVFD